MRRATLVAVLFALAACRRPDAPAHLERARTALFERKPEVALEAYRAALDGLERDESPAASVYRARALRGAADVYALELGDARRAVEVYRELIRRCPEAPDTLEGRVRLASLLHHRLRDTRGAIAELTEALARNPPQSAELSYEVATLYFELQDYSQAELEAAKVVQKYEASAFVDDALYLRGQALALLDGRRAEAERVFLELVDRFPESPLRPHALTELGRLLEEQGHAERAIEVWVQALAQHPAPAMLQANITRVRNRLHAITPKTVGDAVSAFDWNVPGALPQKLSPPKTSAEAVGGTKEEAEKEARQPLEASPPAPPGEPTAPAAPPEEAK